MNLERREVVDLSIAINTTNSGNVYLGSNQVLCGLELPAAFNATTARLVITGYYSEHAALTGTALAPRDYSGTVMDESVITVAATNSNRCVYLAADKWESVNVVKITATLADGATAVTQTAARTITAIVRPY